MVLRSPRLRRRLSWTAAALVAVACVAAVVALLPEHDGKRTAEHLRAGAVLPPTQVPLTPADRRAIDRTLDRFVVDAVAKRDVERARSVVAHGFDPRDVYGYPARGTSFHDWTLNESTGGHVSLDLMLQPTRGAAQRVGPTVFTIRLDRVAGRWLVDSLVPTASFSSQTHKVTAAVDFNPGLGRDPPKPAPLTTPTLGTTWIAVPLVVLGLVVGFPLALLLAKWARGRRAWRRYRWENQSARLPWERPRDSV